MATTQNTVEHRMANTVKMAIDKMELFDMRIFGIFDLALNPGDK